MRLISSLSFPMLTFLHWVGDDREAVVVIVKGTFGINKNDGLGVTHDQAPLIECDTFWGPPDASSLKLEQEIAPFKPCTDLTLSAVARTPDAGALPEWPVSIAVTDRVFYEFYVRGPSEWHKSRDKWQLSAPEPVIEVPIRYELAYGGMAPTEEVPEVYEFNPVGKGFVNETLLDQGAPIPAPQIGDIAEFMSGDIKTNMTVHGLGPIAKAWMPRRSLAGTFNDAWAATRKPRMPKDHALAFWNAAPQRLQCDPYLIGGEQFTLQGFCHDPAPIKFTLPTAGIAAHKDTPDGPKVHLDLTDVQIDIADPNPKHHRVTLIWRGLFANPNEIETIHIVPTLKAGNETQ